MNFTEIAFAVAFHACAVTGAILSLTRVISDFIGGINQSSYRRVTAVVDVCTVRCDDLKHTLVLNLSELVIRPGQISRHLNYQCYEL